MIKIVRHLLNNFPSFTTTGENVIFMMAWKIFPDLLSVINLQEL